MVIWITGISGAGKTTIAHAMMQCFKRFAPELFLLDGDQVRELFGNDLEFDEQARFTQIGRIQRLAKMLENQEILVVVAALYSHPDLLGWNRENFKEYFEVYLDMPLDLVKQRDPKGLYARAERGETKNVVGMDLTWHPPLQPNMVIHAQDLESPESLAFKIARNIPRLSAFIPEIEKGVGLK